MSRIPNLVEFAALLRIQFSEYLGRSRWDPNRRALRLGASSLSHDFSVIKGGAEVLRHPFRSEIQGKGRSPPYDPLGAYGLAARVLNLNSSKLTEADFKTVTDWLKKAAGQADQGCVGCLLRRCVPRASSPATSPSPSWAGLPYKAFGTQAGKKTIETIWPENGGGLAFSTAWAIPPGSTESRIRSTPGSTRLCGRRSAPVWRTRSMGALSSRVPKSCSIESWRPCTPMTTELILPDPAAARGPAAGIHAIRDAQSRACRLARGEIGRLNRDLRRFHMTAGISLRRDPVRSAFPAAMGFLLLIGGAPGRFSCLQLHDGPAVRGLAAFHARCLCPGPGLRAGTAYWPSIRS